MTEQSQAAGSTSPVTSECDVMLAGDIFGKMPMWRSPLIFKAIFCMASALDLQRSLKAICTRKANIREVEAAAS
jgi:hypothetical protein